MTDQEMFQSQTGSPSSSDAQFAKRPRLQLPVSIPNGKPILFRREPRKRGRKKREEFQSQTGSPSSSDQHRIWVWDEVLRWFQSQTGSPSSSDVPKIFFNTGALKVSIPNGKPILFRRRRCSSASRSSMFQSQTGSPSSSDHQVCERGSCYLIGVSIPNGKPILFRQIPAILAGKKRRPVSIPNGKPILFRHGGVLRWLAPGERVSIPNGKPILFRPSSEAGGQAL